MFDKRKGIYQLELTSHAWQLASVPAESAFDASGRPLEPAFYTGFPAYHNLIYEIYEQSQLQDSGDVEEAVDLPVGARNREPPKFWVKRKVMSNIIAEEISEQQVRGSTV